MRRLNELVDRTADGDIILPYGMEQFWRYRTQGELYVRIYEEDGAIVIEPIYPNRRGRKPKVNVQPGE